MYLDNSWHLPPCRSIKLGISLLFQAKNAQNLDEILEFYSDEVKNSYLLAVDRGGRAFRGVGVGG